MRNLCTSLARLFVLTGFLLAPCARAELLEAWDTVVSYLLPGEGRWVEKSFQSDSLAHSVWQDFGHQPSLQRADGSPIPTITLSYKESIGTQSLREFQQRALNNAGPGAQVLRSWSGEEGGLLHEDALAQEWKYTTGGLEVHALWAFFACDSGILTVACDATEESLGEVRSDFDAMLSSVYVRAKDAGGQLLLDGMRAEPGPLAVELHRQYQAMQAGDPYGYFHLGSVYSLLWELEPAVEQLDRALMLYPQMTTALCLRALLKHMGGSCENALPDYAACLEQDPTLCSNYYNQACCLSLAGKLELAMAQLRLAVACGYDNWEQIESDSDLEALRVLPEWQSLR